VIRNYIRFIIFTILMSVFSVNHGISVLASEKNIIPEKVSMERAVQIAFENNQDYKIALLKEKEAGEKVDAAWGQLWPVLESEASAMRQKAENGFMSMSDGQNEIRFVQLKFGLNPGIFYHSLRASQDASKIAKEDMRRIKASVEHSVVKGFFDVLVAGEIVKLQQESIDVLNTNLRDVQNMYKTGTVPKFELLQAALELHKHEPMLLEAKNNKKLALDMFNFTLGSDKLEFEPDDAILRDESMKSPAGGSSKEEYLITTALKNRPELVQLEKKRSLTEHSKNINSSYYLWPTFSIGGYYGKTQYLPNSTQVAGPMGTTIDLSNISGTDEWQNTWQIRVAATYRWGAISPADPTRAAEREEKLKIKEAEEELLKLKRLIGISIKSNYSKLITSHLIIKSQKENVTTAEEGMRVAKESYRAGIIKNSELLSVELSLNNARTSYINAIYGYYVSLAELKKEIGINDERIIMEDIK
jgi:outer membrane protein